MFMAPSALLPADPELFANLAASPRIRSGLVGRRFE
jgi:hypothetical protein